MNKVLIVAYNFPPVGGAGVQRPVKFVKYLREFAWEPLVLTVENPSVPVLDQTLCKDIPSGVEVRGARTLEPSYQSKQMFSNSEPRAGLNLKKRLKNLASYLLLPDLQVLWWPHCCLELLRIIKRDKPDCIFVSAPPFSSFVPAALIGSLCRTPVVLDYRDEWAFSRQQWENCNKSAWAAFTDSCFERFVLSRCSAVTAANASYISSLRKLYPALNKKSCRVITNGYDEEDFARVDPCPEAGGPIKIVYIGTVWKTTSLTNIVAALETLWQDGRLPEFRLEVYGRVVATEAACLTSGPAVEFTTLHGYVDHELVVRRMHEADVLLITLSRLPGVEKIITGKLFEYMATGRHIMAVVPEGETATIVANEYDNATLADPDDLPGIAAGFEAIFHGIDRIRSEKGTCPSRYSRRNLTGDLAELLHRLVEQRAADTRRHE